MQLRPLFLASAAVTVVSAACTGRPCGPDAIIKIVKKPELADAASSFCSAYNQATTTSTETVTTATTVPYTETIPAYAITVTEPFTVTSVATVYSTSYYTVAPAVSTLKKKRAVDFGPLTDLSQFPASRISSACSCVVPTPAPALTLTETETETVTHSFPVTLPGEEEVITVTMTTTVAKTTTVVTAVPTVVVPTTPSNCAADQTTSLCCGALEPWAWDADHWASDCFYVPPDVTETVGVGCMPRPATGCPRPMVEACCKAYQGVVCGLGQNCARV